jgi:hypothetical protein
VGMGWMRKCDRFGDAKQLDFNRKVGKPGTITTLFSAYVQRWRPSFFQWFSYYVLPVLGLGHFESSFYLASAITAKDTDKTEPDCAHNSF